MTVRGAHRPYPRRRRAVRWLAAAMGALVATNALAGATVGSDYALAWRTYDQARARGATPSALRPLAQAAYEALPDRPRRHETMVRKAEAAFALARLDYRTGLARAALALLRESDELYARALGEDTPQRIRPLLEEAKLLSWTGDRKQMRKALKRLALAQRILDHARSEDITARMEVAFRQSELYAALRDMEKRKRALRRFFGLLDSARRRAPAVAVPALLKAGRLVERAGIIPRAAAFYCEALKAVDAGDATTRTLLASRIRSLAEEDHVTIEAACLARAKRWSRGPLHCALKPVTVVYPSYPQRAADLGIQGFVVLELVLDRDGRPRDVWVQESHPLGYFEQAAIKAGKGLRYPPLSGDEKGVCGSLDHSLRYIYTFGVDHGTD